MNHYFYIIIVGFVDSMHHFLTLRFFFFFPKSGADSDPVNCIQDRVTMDTE